MRCNELRDRERERNRKSLLLSEMTKRQTAAAGNRKKAQTKGEAERWRDRDIQQETQEYEIC